MALAACVVMVGVGARAASAGISTNVSSTLPNGEVRESVLYVPDGHAADDPLPVVLAFHGGGGSPEAFRDITGLDAAADANGFAVLYADAGDGLWGDWRDVTGDPANDLEYVSLILDTLAAEHQIDSRRVYATGISNGGAFSLVLASELGQRVAAVAPVAHNISQSFVDNASPEGGVDVLQIVGTEDPINPYQGGAITTPGGAVQGVGLGSDATIAYWQAVIGAGDATETLIANAVMDGTFARQEVYEPAADGTELSRIIVAGGGHTWPGGQQYLPAFLIGPTSQDFDANDAIWEFFKDKLVADVETLAPAHHVPLPIWSLAMLAGLAAVFVQRGAQRVWSG